MYCVRCGDIIDKNELVCDKCGLRFTVVRADGTTVYINQSPTPVNYCARIGNIRDNGITVRRHSFKFGYFNGYTYLYA